MSSREVSLRPPCSRLLAGTLALLLGAACGQDGAPAASASMMIPSAKKGVGTWYFGGVATAMSDVTASWYYTWRVEHQWEPAPFRMQFVPMVWDETHVTPAELAQAVDTNAGILLGYNEPDHPDQADMTVSLALDLWPRLQETGLRLGSPAMAGNPALTGSWLEQFMDGARERGYRVDFVCVHWYGAGTDAAAETAALRSYLQAIHDKYQKPIWLTEFALIRWTSPATFPTYDEQVAFVRQAVPMLESLPFVERYAWFAVPPWMDSGILGTTNLYNEDGTPTPVGVAYRGLSLKEG
jgi:Glycosyl hydrolase catalytic core